MFSKKPNYLKLRQGFRTLATWPIVAYQYTLSPDHGPMKAAYPHGYCRFYPSCSEYTRQAILKNGLIIGSVRGAWRIARCNPLSEGGIDKP